MLHLEVLNHHRGPVAGTMDLMISPLHHPSHQLRPLDDLERPLIRSARHRRHTGALRGPAASH